MHLPQATPHRPSHHPAPSTRHPKHERLKRAEQHTTISQGTTKVEDKTDTPTLSQDPYLSLGDFNDPRREKQSGRSLRMAQIYHAQSPGNPNQGLGEDEESDDELNSIAPVQHVRVSSLHDNASQANTALLIAHERGRPSSG
jgi:hypothetical protein